MSVGARIELSGGWAKSHMESLRNHLNSDLTSMRQPYSAAKGLAAGRRMKRNDTTQTSVIYNPRLRYKHIVAIHLARLLIHVDKLSLGCDSKES